MEAIGRTMATWVTVGAALFAFLVVPGLVAPASAAPVPAGSSTQQWAYGAQTWVNVTANFGNATYTSHAFYTWQVIFTATNTSATTVQLEAQRTMYGSYYADLCAPDCANPTLHGNLSVVGWEKDAGFANLTTAGSVYENGSAVAAVALLDASSQVQGNLTEHLSLLLRTPLVNGTAQTSFFVGGAAHASAAFSPALGLVPLNVSTGDRWNSSSQVTAAGGWSVKAGWSHTGFNGATTNGSINPSGSVAGNGTVALQGFDAGTVTLHNGQTVPVIVLAWSGPFDDEDGLILVPHDFDMFGAGAHSWAHASLAAQTVATANVDVAMDLSHHLRVVAAASAFGSADSSLSAMAAPTHGPSPAAGSPTVLQAQPESVAQAQHNSCVVGGCAAGATGAGLGLLGLAALVGLVVALVVGTIAVIEYRVWSRRRAQSGSPAPSTPVRDMSPVPPPGAVSGGYQPPQRPPAAPPPPPTG